MMLKSPFGLRVIIRYRVENMHEGSQNFTDHAMMKSIINNPIIEVRI
jgi:hypothetical protein